MKLEFDLSPPKAPPSIRGAMLVLVLLLLVFSVFGVWADFPWNGNPFTWLTAKETFLDAQQQRNHFALTDACTGFQKAVKLYPRDPQFIYALAETEERLGKNADAEQHYRDVIKLKPNMIDAWLHMSTVQCIEDKFDLSLQSAQQALKIDPKNPQALCQTAMLLAHLGDRAQAEKLITQSTKLDRDARSYFITGQYYRLLAKPEEAQKYFLKATLLEHGDPEYAEWLGMSYLLDDKASQAREWLHLAVTINSHSPVYWENYAAMLLRLNELDQACIAFEKAHLLDPENLEYHKRFAFCLFDAKHFDLAEEALGDLIYNKKTTDPDAWLYFVHCLEEKKTYGQAEAILRDLVDKVDPSIKARTLSFLGDMYNQQGKVHLAADTYHQALALNPPAAVRTHLEHQLQLQQQHPTLPSGFHTDAR